MNKKTLTGLLSVLCVLLCALVLFCACGGENTPTNTEAPTAENTEAPTTASPETNQETDPVISETVSDGKVTYTITVVDGDGNPVEGVSVQMCNVEGTCLLPVKTDATGVATFRQAEAVYYVTIAGCPEGYTADKETKHNFDEGAVEMTVTIEKASSEQPA